MMGCDTKGCLVTNNKNPFEIAHRIAHSIRYLIQKESGMDGLRLLISKEWKAPKITMLTHCQALTLDWVFNGESCSMFVTFDFDCDCDLKNHPEIEGTSCIWFSLGAWGSSEMLMRTVLQSVSDLGKVYIDVNDCDDIDFVQI